MFFLEGIFLFSWVKCENNSLRARRETEREREKKERKAILPLRLSQNGDELH